MVQYIAAAWGSFLFIFGTVVITTNFLGKDAANERSMRRVAKLRSMRHQRRMVGNGVSRVLQPLRFPQFEEALRRSVENDASSDSVDSGSEASPCPGGIDADDATAEQWYDWHKNSLNEYWECLSSATNFETTLMALHYANEDRGPPIKVDLSVPDSSEQVEFYIDSVPTSDQDKAHTFIYTTGVDERDGDLTWKHVRLSSMDDPDSFKLSQFPDFEVCSENNKYKQSCGIYEISEEDLGCRPGLGDYGPCKERVAAYLDMIKKQEKEMKPLETPGFLYCEMVQTLSGALSEDEALQFMDGHPQAQCDVVACAESESKIDYNHLYACSYSANKPLAASLLCLILMVYFILMGVVADGYLVPALVQIGRGLKMSDALLGATLLALGGAANDFMTGLMSALDDVQNDVSGGIDAGSDKAVRMWLGSVFGTGFFVNTLVAAMVMLFAPDQGIPVKSAVFIRDVSFRIIAVTLMIIFGAIGYVTTATACLMVGFYILYVMLTLKESAQAQSAREQLTDDAGTAAKRATQTAKQLGAGARKSCMVMAATAGIEGATESVPLTQDNEEEVDTSTRLQRVLGWETGDDAGLMDKVNFFVALPLRPLMAVTMATEHWDPLANCLMPFCMAVFIPYGYPLGNLYLEIRDEAGNFESQLWMILGFWAAGALLSALAFKASKASPGHYISAMAYYWATFLTAILWVGGLANEVVGAMTTLGVLMGAKPMTMGITMLAWGNCVDNVFATIGLAKAGEFAVAITGVYAAPMFNVLFGNGLILLMMCLLKGGTTPFLMSLCPAILLSCLVVLLFLTILYASKMGWRVDKVLGMFLAISYPAILVLGFVVEDWMYHPGPGPNHHNHDKANHNKPPSLW